MSALYAADNKVDGEGIFVDRLGGSIRIRSRVIPKPSGTCFSVFFPDQASNAA